METKQDPAGNQTGPEGGLASRSWGSPWGSYARAPCIRPCKGTEDRTVRPVRWRSRPAAGQWGKN